jgi:hypothetical protein
VLMPLKSHEEMRYILYYYIERAGHWQ